jgi:hypothetical protein
MKVRLRFFGMLALKHGSQVELELKEGTSWGEALNIVFERFNLGKMYYEKGSPVSAPGYLLLLLNGAERPPETIVHEGDEILISHPLVGG